MHWNNLHAVCWGMRTSPLSGVLCWPALPLSLVVLDICSNKLEGKVVLPKLPNLQTLNISSNHFSGNFDCTRLPPRLLTLNASDNKFDGLIDLSALPLGLQEINLSGNAFQGPVQLDCINPCLVRLDLSSIVSQEVYVWGQYNKITATTKSDTS